ncbi:MAG: DUF4176 domain-containing protein [Ruminococcaceae bacterium]|nr:DUF4176 domain-containing protein [Oscillospiraceae bacterium]
MTNFKELLPIGSVVILREAKKRLMIYGIRQTNKENKKEYDYIGVLYPEGNLGGKSYVMFNHEDIKDVFFRGYEDEERKTFIDKLETFYVNKENKSEK